MLQDVEAGKPLEIDGQGREFVVLRPVHSERAMTARPADLPAALLAELRESIPALDGVSGLALDLTAIPKFDIGLHAGVLGLPGANAQVDHTLQSGLHLALHF